MREGDLGPRCRARELREGNGLRSSPSRRLDYRAPLHTPRRLCFEDTRVFRSSAGVERSQVLHCSQMTAATGLQKDLQPARS